MKTALLFPGQGAQHVGMMADVAAASAAARRLFERADAQLGYSLSALCFAGPAERLNTTEISQPAIFVCSAAMLAAVYEALGQEHLPDVVMMAGLSLGEYTALYAADAIDFDPALDLVARRGRYMQEAAEARRGGMVSVLGLDEPTVGEICRAAAEGDTLVEANFLCPGNIVLSGDLAACERVEALAAQRGAMKTVRLEVAGAFHSPHMAPAAEKLAEALSAVEFRRPRCPVIANVDAQEHCCAEMIRERLVAQVTSPVRWEASMRKLLDNGVESFYEIGPGRVLGGLMRRIHRRAAVVSLNGADALAKLAGGAAGP